MAKKTKNKQYSLSTEEKTFLLGRKNVAKYLEALIESEMNKYIHDVVRVRLGLVPEDVIEIDIENGKVELKREEAKTE